MKQGKKKRILSALTFVLTLLLIAFEANALGGANAIAFRDVPGAALGPRGFNDFISGTGTHLGNDVRSISGSSEWACGGVIYAPGYGRVVSTAPGTGLSADLGNAVMIHHPGAGRGGRDIYSIILHMQEPPLATVGQQVNPDTVLGHIGMTGGANNLCHAHIELRYFNTEDWFFPDYRNIYARRDVRNHVEPREHWENPDIYSLNLIPISYLDGTGSLIDPTNSGNCSQIGNFGCSFDKIRLHGHATPSTGAFQVVSQRDRCEYVRLEGLQSALITVKRWNETYPRNSDGLSTIYRANSLPVNLRLPADQWMMVAVTTTAPIPTGERRDITLRCLTYSEYMAQAPPTSQLKDIAPPLTDRARYPDLLLNRFGADFHLSGVGSLVTFSNSQLQTPNTYQGFGRDKDIAIKLSSKKSLMAFQIFSDGGNCRTVRISSASGINTASIVEASLKGWSSQYWGPSVASSIPFNIQLPAGRSYWILKLKPAAIGVENIRVECL